jgi:hypothetical protein
MNVQNMYTEYTVRVMGVQLYDGAPRREKKRMATFFFLFVRSTQSSCLVESKQLRVQKFDLGGQLLKVGASSNYADWLNHWTRAHYAWDYLIMLGLLGRLAIGK